LEELIMTNRTRPALLVLAIAAVSSGFSLPRNAQTAAAGPLRNTVSSVRLADDEMAKVAVAKIYGAGETHDKITGTATFTQIEHGVKIVVDVDGLTPGKHGIHIHEKPDLTDPKLISAGAHFNPGGAEHHHGSPDDAKRHAGDLGNIEVDDKGHGHLELKDDELAVDGKNGVVGHSVIIHAKVDDLKTQPSGASGDRVAGGAIVLKGGD
jgi:Cu-Zn family superoxide dismutase